MILVGEDRIVKLRWFLKHRSIDSPPAAAAMELKEEAAPRELRMEMWSCCLPYHDEDAHFCHAETGVADGVGGYRQDGVDAAAFSHGLMTNAFNEVDAGTRIIPYLLLQSAYRRTVAERTPGASTAVILSLTGRTLDWAYVGDSGFVVFRDGEIVQRSTPQQSFFNCPLQLSADSGSSKVSDAAVGGMEVREGDVVVVASDGLFDNVFDTELEKMVQRGMELSYTPMHMAYAIADEAYQKSRDNGTDSPFSAASRKENATSFKCGKKDDITIVVAFIVS